MIEIKLSFASVDEAIAYLQGHSTAPATLGAAEQPETKPPAPAPKPKAEKTASPPAAAASSQPETAAASPASSPAASASAPAGDVVDYPTLQKAVFALAGKSREAAGAVAAAFGVKTFKELPDTRWGEALAAVLAKSAELEAA